MKLHNTSSIPTNVGQDRTVTSCNVIPVTKVTGDIFSTEDGQTEFALQNYRFVWRKKSVENRWFTKNFPAATLDSALEKVIKHISKVTKNSGEAELDHFVQEFCSRGHQNCLHTLTLLKNPIPVIFKNKSHPPGYFPLKT